ncbi:MAG: hypothetical protein K8S25_08095 [Alphaproteobacteria bacterium]|nr:hypothetical protein [Alphaproteobacteria bacterium]
MVAAALASYLCLYALTSVSLAWDFAHAEPRYAAVARGKIGTALELDALIPALRASPFRADLSRAAFVQMVMAQQIGLKSLRATTRMAAARRDLRLGLAAAPSDAYAWTRLAVAEMHLGNIKAAAGALSIAMQIAPAERKLTPIHFDLAVALLPELDAQGKATVARRLQIAAKWPELTPALSSNSANALRSRLKSE